MSDVAAGAIGAGDRDRRVRFVLPAYNEAASIGDLLDRIAEVMEDTGEMWSVLVVDDGSADETGEIARDRGVRLPVAVVRNEPNRGLGFTIRRGLKTVAAETRGDDVVVTLDADLTQDPGYVPALLAAIDAGADVAIASRYRKGARVQGLGWLRHLTSYGASAVVTVLRPIRGVRDYSCGFRAYRAHVLKWGFSAYGDDFVSEDGFACMVEIAQRLKGHAAFVEVPFVLRYDAKRKASTIRVWPTIVAYFRVLGRVRRDARRLAVSETRA